MENNNIEMSRKTFLEKEKKNNKKYTLIESFIQIAEYYMQNICKFKNLSGKSKKELQELLNIIDDKIDIGLESINALNLGENIINLDDELADYYRDLKSGVDQGTELYIIAIENFRELLDEIGTDGDDSILEGELECIYKDLQKSNNLLIKGEEKAEQIICHLKENYKEELWGTSANILL